MTKLVEGSIKSGVTIAGVLGDYPSADYPLTGASAVVNDLDATTFNAKVKSATQFEYFDSTGSRYTGNGDADIVAANVADGIDIFGTEGTAVLETHSNCASDGATGCVAVAAFKAVDMTKLVEGVVKKGVSIAGVTGDYPSATYRLSANTAVADLLQSSFETQVVSGDEFEWFDGSGDRKYRAVGGDADIIAGNIKTGVTIFGVPGSLTVESHSDCSSDAEVGCVTTSRYKAADTDTYSEWDVRKGIVVGGKSGEIVFYKNQANTATQYNRTTGDGALAGVDAYDTIDDFNGGGGFPTETPSGWVQATGANWIMDAASDNGDGGGTAGNGLCEGTEACVFKDRLTNLLWTKTLNGGTTYSWEDAISQCENLSYGGITDWRLPTQKEWLAASINSMWTQKDTNRLSVATTAYWTSTTRGHIHDTAWIVAPVNSLSDPTNRLKTDLFKVMCVSGI
jgi:hypothetical protein